MIFLLRDRARVRAQSLSSYVPVGWCVLARNVALLSVYVGDVIHCVC